MSAAGEGSAKPGASATPSPETPPTNAGGQTAASTTDTDPTAGNGAIPDPSETPDTGEKPGTVAVQPPLLTKLVQKAGLTFDDIDYSQLVLVAADGSKAAIYCYDKSENGVWKLNESLGYMMGYAGRNGVNTDKHEGDGCSPGGLFGLGYAFGNNPKPETGMPWRAITNDTYWIDDPNSKYYNQWVEGTDDADWTGGEHLSENVVSYAYAVVIEYNTVPNTVAGKGSAIFFHIGSKPTSGCVAVTQDTLLKILKWLSEDKQPGMLIVGN
jgi:L,D-peptidoglycan transpeptidase YkuD (ErfK/YbiS/YcfS/YnhG family)